MCKQRRRQGSNQPREFNLFANTKHIYASNFIKTSKYNIVSFLPKAIIIQFKRYANIYFLAAAILQSIPAISPLNPFTAIAPFVLVILLSVLREGLEDWPRHKSDKETNSSITKKMNSNGNKDNIKWADVEVGQLIYVENEDSIPADLILIYSSDHNNICFIETASLDGEKTLKPKICDELLRNYINDHLRFDENILSKWKMHCPKPDPYLYQYEGYLVLEDGRKLSITQKQLLLRGAKLKNTKWVIGIVVYTGVDTKIMKNASKSKYKQSKIEIKTNNAILIILLCQLILCAITAIGNSIWLIKNQRDHWYLQNPQNFSLESFEIFLASFLLYNTMIPISLIVSLEFVKLIQGYFIEKDEELYVAQKDKKPKVFTVSINEELGQISYIFSDKTGTLTSNKMEFTNCLIGEEIYGTYKPIAMNFSLDVSENFTDNNKSDKSTKESNISKFDDPILKEYFEGKRNKEILIEMTDRMENQNSQLHYSITNQRQLIMEFWEMMTICHECVVDTNDNNNNEIKYQGMSPDEIAILENAKKQGFIFKGINNKIIYARILNEKKRWELLRLFEFNSERKRMSVIIKDKDIIKMYVKGADSVIKKRLKDAPQPYLSVTEERLRYYSNFGLRTLLYAMRIMTEEEFLEMEKKINSLIDAENRDQKICNI